MCVLRTHVFTVCGEHYAMCMYSGLQPGGCRCFGSRSTAETPKEGAEQDLLQWQSYATIACMSTISPKTRVTSLSGKPKATVSVIHGCRSMGWDGRRGWAVPVMDGFSGCAHHSPRLPLSLPSSD